MPPQVFFHSVPIGALFIDEGQNTWRKLSNDSRQVRLLNGAVSHNSILMVQAGVSLPGLHQFMHTAAVVYYPLPQEQETKARESALKYAVELVKDLGFATPMEAENAVHQ